MVSPATGPTSSSCRGLRPLIKDFFGARKVPAPASLKIFRPYCCVMYIDKENQRNLAWPSYQLTYTLKNRICNLNNFRRPKPLNYI